MIQPPRPFPNPPPPVLLDGLSDHDCKSMVGIDTRHRLMLAELIVASGARHVLEIGCGEGYSTAALCWLLRERLIDRLDLCDIWFHPNIVKMCRDLPGVSMLLGQSAEFLSKPQFPERHPDFIFIDGDHRTESVREELPLVLATGCPNIAAHDTGWWYADDPKFRYDPGPKHIRWTLQSEPGWLTLTDDFYREGESTERGLTFATRSADIYAKAQPIFRRQGI